MIFLPASRDIVPKIGSHILTDQGQNLLCFLKYWYFNFCFKDVPKTILYLDFFLFSESIDLTNYLLTYYEVTRQGGPLVEDPPHADSAPGKCHRLSY